MQKHCKNKFKCTYEKSEIEMMRVGGKYIYICISDKAATGFSHKNMKSKMVHDKGADVNLKNSLWCYFMGSLMLQKLRVTVRVLDIAGAEFTSQKRTLNLMA